MSIDVRKSISEVNYNSTNVPLYTEVNFQAKTVTPETSAQIVSADEGYDGLSSVTINGDINLTPDNVKKDVNIFGVTGTFEGGVIYPDPVSAGSVPIYLGTDSSSYSNRSYEKRYSYIAPVAGTYSYDFAVRPFAKGYFKIYKNGIAYSEEWYVNDTFTKIGGTIIVDAGDTIELWAYAASNEYNIRTFLLTISWPDFPF